MPAPRPLTSTIWRGSFSDRRWLEVVVDPPSEAGAGDRQRAPAVAAECRPRAARGARRRPRPAAKASAARRPRCSRKSEHRDQRGERRFQIEQQRSGHARYPRQPAQQQERPQHAANHHDAEQRQQIRRGPGRLVGRRAPGAAASSRTTADSQAGPEVKQARPARGARWRVAGAWPAARWPRTGPPPPDRHRAPRAVADRGTALASLVDPLGEHASRLT